MSLIQEMLSAEAFLKTKFPSAAILLYEAPQNAAAGSFSVVLLNDLRTSETHLHIRTEREYQIRYTGLSAEEALETMDLLSSHMYQNPFIPVQGLPRFIRIASFAFAAASLNESGLYTCTGTLRTEGRAARTQEAYEKMQHVYVQQVTV